MRRLQRDAMMVDLVRGGDNDAFGELFHAYRGCVLRRARNMVGGEDEARDVAQEVFLTAFEKLDMWEARAPLAAWLLRITTNVCLNRRRRMATRQRAAVDLRRMRSADTVGEMIPCDLVERVRAAVDQLPERRRRVLLLRYFQGLSTKETAEELGITTSSVRVTVHTAFASLRLLMRDLAADN